LKPAVFAACAIAFGTLAAACGSLAPASPSPIPSPAVTRTPLLLGPSPTPAPTRPIPTSLPPPPTLLPLPDIGLSDWSLGPDGAPATLLVYSDFQSSGAADLLETLFGLTDRHPDDLRLVFRHLPLVHIFDKDSLAGQAAEAAGALGGFWEMARALTERYAEWSVLAPPDFVPWVTDLAGELGLDAAAFRSDLDNGRYAAFMLATYEEAVASGLPGGPLLYLNGSLVRVPPTPLNLEAAVRLQVLSTSTFQNPPAMSLRAGADYFATFVFDDGEVVVQLLPEVAPEAVNSFVFLARRDWFDDTLIYRVVPEGWVEAGDPSATGLGDSGYHLPDEIDAAWNFDEPGRLALASVGPGTGSSRFLITLAPRPEFNGTRTIFGRVLRGLDFLRGLASRDPATDLLDPNGLILKDVLVEIET
jgi:peptidylprolyl isomerase